MEALGFRLAIRGRSERPRRSVSASEIEDDEEREDMCARPLSFGWGIVGTGDEPCTSEVDAMIFCLSLVAFWWNLRTSRAGWWLFPSKNLGGNESVVDVAGFHVSRVGFGFQHN